MRYELLAVAVLALAVFTVACWWLVAYAKQILDDISEPTE